MTRPTVLLFDIDGTLVTHGGVGRRAIERAFDKAHGRPDACALIRFDGMTDRLITRLALTAIGIEPTDAAIDALLATYTLELQAELALPSSDTYRPLTGVVETLEAARARGAAMGVGTGNTADGARLKLEHVGLSHYFDFGGYGSDHEVRVELIRIAAQRGASRLGLTAAECRVVVIGDTPKDVDAALGIGAECIGVGTGSYSTAELRAHGATYAFDDLTAAGVLDALLG